jgi:hypothetical protein
MLIAARKLSRAGYKTGCFVMRDPRPPIAVRVGLSASAWQ